MTSAMSPEQLVALAIFASYFLSIFVLFFLIVRSISNRRRASESSGSVSKSHVGLALASFAHTWYYMIAFMRWSFVEYERSATGAMRTAGRPMLVRVADWLRNTALFEQAWTIVCDGPLRWWWSEQLCLFTVGFWTVFLLTKGREHGVKHVWAYMLFGQLVAISVATNLFFLALPPPPPPAAEKKEKEKPDMTTVPPSLWLSVLASLTTVFLVPHSLQHDYFLPNLLVMHVILLVPLLVVVVVEIPTTTQTRRCGPPLRIRTRTLYKLVALLAAIVRLRSNIASATADASASGGGDETLWAVLGSHAARASIGWDVVWTTISFLTMWVSGSGGRGQLMVLFLATGMGSIGTSAPLSMI